MALVALCHLGECQSELNGENQYPQFRTFSGLPGSGFGLDHTGRLSFRGAMGISIPVAYSVGKGKFAFGASNTNSKAWTPAFATEEKGDVSNGTAWGMTGLSTPVGNLTVGGMLLSRIGDSVTNLHFQPRMPEDPYSSELRRVDFGIGVQDVFNTGGAHGQGLATVIGGGTSRSFYVSATGRLSDDLFVTLGTGTQRFKGLFGGASYNVMPRLKAVAEYDAFNFNYGLAYDLGSSNFQMAAFLGHIRGKYLTWGLTIGF